VSRPITEIHEIELSSKCNLACVYCPNPTMQRSKRHMEWMTYLRALQCVEKFCEAGTQTELALTGVGEALLHPRFADAVLLARQTIGDRLLTFSTNGILLSDELLERIAPANPTIYISLHRPEAAGPALKRVRAHGLPVGTNASFVTSALNWTGQVNWHVSHRPIICEYLRSGWCVIRADGTVGTCCWDAETISSYIGTVWTDPTTWCTAPHRACESCSLTVPSDMREVA
jgi:hypothetical protein